MWKRKVCEAADFIQNKIQQNGSKKSLLSNSSALLLQFIFLSECPLCGEQLNLFSLAFKNSNFSRVATFVFRIELRFRSTYVGCRKHVSTQDVAT